jgi:tetratricopeptide (TPR) repeat protein
MKKINARRIILISLIITLAFPCMGGGKKQIKAYKKAFQEAEQKVNKFYNQGRYIEAIPYAKEMLEIVEKTLDKDHPNVAACLNNLAMLYYATGRYSEAEPLYKRALDITEKTLGKDHLDVATCLNNLAGLYHDIGNYTDAESLHKRALKIREKALGKDHPDVY